jgi:hypothetical protein
MVVRFGRGRSPMVVAFVPAAMAAAPAVVVAQSSP